MSHRGMMNRASESCSPMKDALSGAALGTRTKNNPKTHLGAAVGPSPVSTQLATEEFDAVWAALATAGPAKRHHSANPSYRHPTTTWTIGKGTRILVTTLEAPDDVATEAGAKLCQGQMSGELRAKGYHNAKVPHTHHLHLQQQKKAPPSSTSLSNRVFLCTSPLGASVRDWRHVCAKVSESIPTSTRTQTPTLKPWCTSASRS